jgi:Tfp pilus assembly protein PilX
LPHAGFALPVALLTLLVVAVFALAADVTATAVLRETAAFAEGIHAQNAARAGVADALQSVRQASASCVPCAVPLLGQLDARSGFVAQVVCVQAAVYQIRACGWTLGMGRATATVTYNAATNCIESWLCN